jgi:hypothetical protein
MATYLQELERAQTLLQESEKSKLELQKLAESEVSPFSIFTFSDLVARPNFSRE